MVSHQIDDVQHKFHRLEELEKSGWIVEQDVPKKKPMKVCQILINYMLYFKVVG